MRRTFAPSKGNRRPPQRLPGSRGAPEPQEVASGAVRHYAPSGAPTYTTPAPSSSPRTSTPQRHIPTPSAVLTPQVANLIAGITDALTPGPSVHEIAQAAATLGVKPKIEPQPSNPIGSVVQDFAKNLNALDRGVKGVVTPAREPRDFGGKQTLGNVTERQFLAAAAKGALGRNRTGKLTTPATRRAAQNLAGARIDYRRSARPVFPGLDPEQAQVTRRILSVGRQKGATPKELLAALETGLDESGLRNLGYGTGSSEGWRQELTTEYGGHAHNVRASAQDFFNETAAQSHGKGMTPGELAQAVQRPANPDPALYEQFRSQALPILQGFLHGQASPKAAKELRTAKAQAAALGIPTKAAKPLNGDVTPGGPGVVFVRADAKGMVQWAQSALGVTEGSPREAAWAAAVGISPSTPWCSAFIAAGLARRGIKPPSDPAYSGSWLNWSGGKHVNAIQNAKPGDLLIFDWGDGGITDHVALYTGNGQMISGNDANNSVGRSSVPTGNIVGIVRPLYHGGKVAVREATPLPGGSTAGTGAAVPAGGAGGEGSVPATQRPERLPVSVTPLALNPLLAAGAALPGSFQRFQLGAEEEPEGESPASLVAQILKRRART